MCKLTTSMLFGQDGLITSGFVYRKIELDSVKAEEPRRSRTQDNSKLISIIEFDIDGVGRWPAAIPD